MYCARKVRNLSPSKFSIQDRIIQQQKVVKYFEHITNEGMSDDDDDDDLDRQIKALYVRGNVLCRKLRNYSTNVKLLVRGPRVVRGMV